MPRDGSNVYSKPAGTTAIPNTTIESAKFNSVIDDIAADLNLARPITAGGTGGTSVATALAALGVVGVVRRQVFTSSGTYTPHANMLWCEVESWGGGGAGGGTAANSATQSSVGTGGHGGAKAYATLTRSQIGASQAVTIGAGGTGVFGGTGNTGGNTTLGALVNARGGPGGGLVGPLVRSAGAFFVQSAVALQSTVGDILGFTWAGGHGSAGETIILGGRGGADPLVGSPGIGASIASGGSAGGAASGRAAGGGGAAGAESAGVQAGGAGTAGLIIITEYCSS